MLKQALIANAVFSAGAAAVFLLAPARFAAEIPAPGWFWRVLGAGLALFAVQLVLMVMKPALTEKLTQQVVVSDIVWVVATSIALLVFFEQLTRTGVALVLAVNVVVGALAVLQAVGWKRRMGTAS